MEKEKVSDHFMRLGMSAAMKQRVERWRVEQLDELGRVPSFSEAVRMLVERGLGDEIERLRRLVEIGDVRCESCGAPATTIDGDGDAACAGCSA